MMRKTCYPATNNVKNQRCCPTTKCFAKKDLVRVKRCTQVSFGCLGGLADVFNIFGGLPSVPPVNFPDGVFTTINTSTDIIMTWTIIDANGTTTYTVLPQSSLTVFLNGVRNIFFTCLPINFPPSNEIVGESTVELDLQFCVQG